MPLSPTRPDIEIHPQLPSDALTGVLAPRRPLWSPRQLADLTATIAADFAAPLATLLRFDPDHRWWARLALTDGVELWLLSWLPGQRTRPHDHGGASGSFAVFRGELAERYRYPGGPVRDRRHSTGSVLGFGAGRAHQVGAAADSAAASVHAYSPPLVPTRTYPSLADIPGRIPPLPGVAG